MPTDNLVLNAGSGGATVRTLGDAGGEEWPASVVSYATTISAGANVLQVVTPSAGLPVAQQGTWTVTGAGGTFPVTGTFWQGTQPISGSVTAAQATAANLLCTASQGGTWTNTVTQATAGSLNATVIGTGTFAVQAAQSGTFTVQPGNTANTTAWLVTGAGGTFPVTQATAGNLLCTASQGGTWNVGTVTTVTTVSALTSITNALPAGTNLLGSAAVGQQIANVFNGTTALTPQYVVINASTSGNNTIITGTAGKKIYVLRWSLAANGSVNAYWATSTGPTAITGTHYMTQYATAGGSYCPAGIFATLNVADNLILNLSAAVAVGGELTYVVF